MPRAGLSEAYLALLGWVLTDELTLQRYHAKTRWVPSWACLWWTGAVSARGHGRFWPGESEGRDVVVIAHRFAWALAFGVQDLLGVPVLGHRCDNPLCQRTGPGHVQRSSAHQNVRKWAARRHTYGNPLRDSRGSRGRARMIRDLLRGGATGADFAHALHAGLLLDAAQQPLLQDEPQAGSGPICAAARRRAAPRRARRQPTMRPVGLARPGLGGATTPRSACGVRSFVGDVREAPAYGPPLATGQTPNRTVSGPSEPTPSCRAGRRPLGEGPGGPGAYSWLWGSHSEQHRQAGQPIGPGVPTVGDQRGGADPPADGGPVAGDQLVADEPDEGRDRDQQQVVDAAGVQEPAQRDVPGQRGGGGDEQHDDQAGEVLGAAVTVSEAPGRRATAQGEGNRQRDCRHCVGKVVQDVTQQRD